ncbi:MAG: hypothetical protein LC789_06710 [Actinobacteria bacterium]|nr:hypothetical protein [Actinomycetota bacterium]MCA1722182.1 hypothetical protein [Actinomycetota bacterium]
MDACPRALLALLCAAAVAVPAVPAAADGPVYAPGTAPLPAAPSLPSVASGHRPGPDVLYAAPPRAPQLENRDPRFRASPLLVSGTEAYVAGEYLYQDYLYDDHGSLAMPVDPANQTATDSTTVNGLSANALAYQVGSITYPTDPVYAGNAADLVEFRMVPGADSTAYRFTLDTLRRADTTILTLALDTDRSATTGARTLPRDPGASFPGTDAVLTTWGTGAEVSTFAADGTLLKTTPVQVRTDLEADQLTVTVPRSVQDPSGKIRATLAAGLYDKASGGWKRPKSGDPTATDEGGAGLYDPSPSGILNLGFRFDEPVQHQNTPPDEQQAEALRAHRPTAYAHEIDVTALRSKATRSTVPSTGLQIRMYPSRLHLGDGLGEPFPNERGQLQPYAVHIPPSGATGRPHGLLLSIHSNGQHYWQYDGTGIMTELGDARDAVVLSPLGRGHGGWYIDSSEDDIFESWADLARHVRLDPEKVAISGYSMGGYATYRLGGLYPDLFGKAFSVVGPPGKKLWIPPMPPSDGIQTLSNLWLENTRNVPFLNFAMSTDELVPVVGPVAQNLGNPALGIKGFDQLGYRFRFLLFEGGEHYTLAALGYHFPIAQQFLGDAKLDRDPAHVTFAYVPGSDNRGFGLVHDHAYWVSDVRLADLSAGPGAKGVLDVRSEAFGVGDPASAPEQTAGVQGLPYVEKGRTWGPVPKTPVANKADVTVTNLRTATLQLDRARLTTVRPLTLDVTADRASTLVLAGASASTIRATKDGQPAPLTRSATALTLPVAAGHHVYVLQAAATTAAQPVDVQLPRTGAPVAAALAGLVLLATAAGVGRRRAS